MMNPVHRLVRQSKTMFALWRRTPPSARRTAPSSTALPAHRAVRPRPPGGLRDERERWVLKRAFGRMGDSVVIGALVTEADWDAALAEAARSRASSAVQERFVVPPLEFEAGPLYPALGAFLVNGRFAGYYSRASRGRSPRTRRSMWRPWSKPLEWLGRLRLTPAAGSGRRAQRGGPPGRDARGTADWRGTSRPSASSTCGGRCRAPWEPFHCVPLFAALDRVPRRRGGPAPPPRRGRAPADPGTAPVLPPRGPRRPAASGSRRDLDDPRPARPGSVEAAAWLVARHASPCAPSTTGRTRGRAPPEHTLAELLRWASTVAEARARAHAADLAPALDLRQRAARHAPGRPGEFDNRYFSTTPSSPVTLGRRGDAGARTWRRTSPTCCAPASPCCTSTWPTRRRAAPFAAPAKPRRRRGRASGAPSAGGFGTEVPEPSSGGSSG
jgi:hypothetical protein